MLKIIAFVRNINVGQKKFPDRLQLEQAFLAAGAHHANSFQSNGTVVAGIDDGSDLRLFAASAGDYLRQHCNFSEAIFVRDFEAVKKAVQHNPYTAAPYNDYPHKYVSYYQCDSGMHATFPLESPKKDCLVFMGSQEEAYSIARDINGISGYPTPLLEKTLQVPVTTRSWTTINRLIAKF